MHFMEKIISVLCMYKYIYYLSLVDIFDKLT